MNPATHGTEGNASVPVLYMALELSNTISRLAFGDGVKRRQVTMPAADLMKLAEAVAKAKVRFTLPVSVRVVSCYEAGRDGFWLDRHFEERWHREPNGGRCQYRGEMIASRAADDSVR